MRELIWRFLAPSAWEMFIYLIFWSFKLIFFHILTNFILGFLTYFSQARHISSATDWQRWKSQLKLFEASCRETWLIFTVCWRNFTHLFVYEQEISIVNNIFLGIQLFFNLLKTEISIDPCNELIWSKLYVMLVELLHISHTGSFLLTK